MLTNNKPRGRPSSRKSQNFIVSTVGEVAQFFRVSVAAVNKWKSEANAMPGKSGQYDLSEIADWRLKRAEARSGRSGASEKKKNADADRAVLALEEERWDFELKKGLYSERSEVERTISATLVKMRERLLTIPESVSLQMPLDFRAQAFKEADTRIRAILVALHGDLTSDVSDTAGSDRSGSAAAVHPDAGMVAGERADAAGDGNSG